MRTWIDRLRRSRAGVTALALLVGLLLAELVARLAFAAPGARPRYVGEILRSDTAPDQPRRLAPGNAMLMSFVGPDGVERSVEHRVGPHGWRGPVFERRPADGVWRIGCVGDSNVFGWGVAEDQTWPALLARELSRAGRSVELLNLGIPNLDAEEKLEVAQQEAFELGCELVLFALHFDDFFDEQGVRPNLGGNARALAWTRPGATPWLDNLRALSRCVDLAVERYRQRLLTRANLARRERMLAPESLQRRSIERALAELARSSRERGVAVLGLVIPMPVREGEGFASARIDAELSRMLAQAGLEEVALTAELAQSPGELQVHPLDLHLNAQAHATIARVVAPRVAALRR